VKCRTDQAALRASRPLNAVTECGEHDGRRPLGWVCREAPDRRIGCEGCSRGPLLGRYVRYRKHVVALPLLRTGFKWLAVDDRGQVGIFSTACYGPVLSPVMDHAAKLDDVTGGDLDELPVVGGYHTAAGEGGLAYWERKARRGLFGFDWLRDIGPYRRVTVPRVSISTGTLPSHIQQVIRLVRLPGGERISTSYAPRNNVVNPVRDSVTPVETGCAAWPHDPCNIAAAVVPPRHGGCRC
jgi:hypothetical protein